ncbi:hypothetical protein BN133_1652 [Cronobacter dublinensis 582]|nr:hypothetical protein BN133_1652 [Cronobacter dublinensis 582]
MRNTDELHVGEHDARTLFTVIHQHVDAFGAKLSVEFLGKLLYAEGFVHVHRQNRDLERRDSVRPDDTAIVMVLLDSRSHHARHADAVAAHGQDLVAAIFALNGRFQRVGVFGAQLEDVAHFDAALDKQRTLAVRARIAGHDVTDIGHFWRRDITIPVDAEIVFAVDVGACGEIAHGGNAAVDNHRNRHVHRAKRARPRVDYRADFRFGRERQRACHLRQFLGFHVVQLVIATHQQGDQRIFTAFGGFNQQRFHGFLNRQVELLDQLGDGFRVRRVNQRHLLGCGSARGCRRNGFGKFNIRGVVGRVGEDDIVFAALRQHLELMRRAAANRAGIGLYRTEIETHTAEDFAVGLIHCVVRLLQRFLGGMERVSVFHQELARAHHAETRAHFVAEFGLDLEEVERQLLIRAQLVTDQIGDNFFMRRAENERAIAAIDNAQQLRAVLLPAAALLPQLSWLNDWHRHLDSTGVVHLFTHDVFDFFQDAQTSRQPGV